MNSLPSHSPSYHGYTNFEIVIGKNVNLERTRLLYSKFHNGFMNHAEWTALTYSDLGLGLAEDPRSHQQIDLGNSAYICFSPLSLCPA